jgi:hypothetical protein
MKITAGVSAAVVLLHDFGGEDRQVTLVVVHGAAKGSLGGLGGGTIPLLHGCIEAMLVHGRGAQI